MKRATILALVIVVGVALAAGCSSSSSPTKTYTKSDTSITAGAGQQFIIQLDSNPTTGYAWNITNTLDTAVVKKVRSVYIANQTAKGVVGSGGVEKWTFEGVAKGTATIEMGYARSFEKGVPPVQTATFKVTIN